MALYLKYRPQNLDELIGQEAVKKTLLSAFASEKLSHAYLFVGPRGTGKTSTARILAKMINCEKTPAPCNTCPTCLSITDGSNLDLIEIDAASNRGIDDIRTLRENIKLSPSASKKKIYIIDEVHMLTTEAFNALLKTLEEPPAHAVFIMATTELNKVPQTILSRVQRLDFKLATQTDLLSALIRVANGEKLTIPDEVFKLLIKKADGSFRDGVKLLDQLSSGEITKEAVENLLQSGDFTENTQLIESLSKKDATSSLTILLKLGEKGINFKNLTLNLMETLRNLVFIKNGLGTPLVQEEVGSEKYQTLVELAEKFTTQDLIKNLEALQKATEQLKTASIPSLPLELAMVEMSQLSVLRSQFVVPTALGRTDSSLPVISQTVTDKQKTEELLTDNRQPKTDNRESTEVMTDSANSPDIVKLQDKWTFVLETIRPTNFSLEALLRSVKVRDCDNGIVLLEVPYEFHQRILEAPKSRDLLEHVLSDVLEKPVKVSTVVGVRPQRIEDIANVEMAQDDEIISLASEIFNGKLID